MSAVTIRPATPDDLPAITRLDDAHEDFEEFMQSNLNKDDWLLLVATAGNRVIAYGSATIRVYPPIYRDPRYGYIQDVAVTAAYRGQGVGRQLFERMAAWFREKGVSRLELEVSVTNEVSQAFWQKIGFTDFTKKLSLNL